MMTTFEHLGTLDILYLLFIYYLANLQLATFEHLVTLTKIIIFLYLCYFFCTIYFYALTQCFWNLQIIFIIS